MNLSQNEKLDLLKGLIYKMRTNIPRKMEAFNNPARYKFCWGGRGGGKSESIGRILLDLANRQTMKILCTREIQNSIAESVHSLLSTIIYELYPFGEYSITEKSIYNNRTGSEFIFAGLYQQGRKQSIKSIANINICWVEEAQAVSKQSLDILIPSIRAENSEIWFSFNRLFPDDPVWTLKNRIPEEQKIEVNINYQDNPFLPDVLRIEADLSKSDYRDGVSEDYPHIWCGHPVGLTENSIIKLSAIEQTHSRQVSNEGAFEIGVDVARHGKDRTVIALRKGHKLVDLRIHQDLTTIETAEKVIDCADFNKSTPLKIDDTGVGGGVTDYLERQGYNVVPINFAERADDPDKYPNVISEMWFQFRGLLPEICLPNNPGLTAELIGREYYLDTKGRRCVEPKDRFKKRYGKSPDLADAVLLCFYNRGADANIFLV